MPGNNDAPGVLLYCRAQHGKVFMHSFPFPWGLSQAVLCRPLWRALALLVSLQPATTAKGVRPWSQLVISRARSCSASYQAINVEVPWPNHASVVTSCLFARGSHHDCLSALTFLLISDLAVNSICP